MLIVGGPLHGGFHKPDDTVPSGYVPTDIRVKSDFQRVMLWHELFGSPRAASVHRDAIRRLAQSGLT